MLDDAILYNATAGVATVTINRAHKHNAFNDKMLCALTNAFNCAKEDASVRVIILQSVGDTFSAGADLHWMKRMVNYSEAENRADATVLAHMLNTLYHCPKPTIAKIQGAAFGGALGLIACCDIAIATKLSKFCLSEVKLGLAPATIAPYVIEAIGVRAAKRYMQSAEVFSAATAHKLGLLTEVVSETELDEQVSTFVQLFLHNGPQAMAATKALISHCTNHPLDEALIDHTSRLIAQLRVSPEGQEGLNAFFDKRAASWRQQEL
jgi:methylglutaconyl-CoA hydratase